MKRIFTVLIGIVSPARALAAGKHLSDYGFDCSKIDLPIPGCGGSTDVVTALTTLIVGNGKLVAGSLAIIVFLYGGLRMTISQGNEGKDAGKKALIYGALGFACIFLAAEIVTVVQSYISAI